MAEEIDIATEVWKQTFQNGPYSSFHMLDVIANSLGLSYRDILTSPEKLKRFKHTSVTQENLYEPPFLSTWSRDTGRCTSFALKVAHRLEAEYPNRYSFQYYDVGRHRVARCKNTGILIDSSSRFGSAALLNESNEWSEISGLSGRWKYTNGVLAYERNEKSGIRRASPITAARAMGACLQEVANDVSLVCLFRSVGSSEIQFGGMIKWNIMDRRVELTPVMRHRDRMIHFSFTSKGTRETYKICENNLVDFIKKFGDVKQWEVDDTDKIHETLWTMALSLWGFPVCSWINIDP
ncbi:hypothetical protein F5Y05DRAFT_38354 [Hypoxylon sp. FL0543]|nr:hypothetical protein F5Y05DRAFT_38354 [Hypoxylon sp. FL0543]